MAECVSRGFTGILTLNKSLNNLQSLENQHNMDFKLSLDLPCSDVGSPRSIQSPGSTDLDLSMLSNSDTENDSSMNASKTVKKKRGPNTNKPKTVGMTRRNARERNRVRFLNTTFDILRQHLPAGRVTPVKSKSKKLSKVCN